MNGGNETGFPLTSFSNNFTNAPFNSFNKIKFKKGILKIQLYIHILIINTPHLVQSWSNIKWGFEAERKKKAARNYLVPNAESKASHMEIHSNSPTSQYSFFKKTVVLHSNWGMVTSTATLYA